VADLVPERAEAAAEKAGVSNIYGDGSEMISDPDVDAIVFATPTAYRDELVIAALEADKHVLIEKPPAMNAGIVERMIEARGENVAASCSSRFHAYESARVAADFVSAGKLGEIRSIHCRAFTPARGTPSTPPPAWRLRRSANGGGILVNWGSYDLDFLLAICAWELKPQLALARTWQVPPRSKPNVAKDSDAETHVVALILCENGGVISYERGEYMPSQEQNVWQIIGTDGSLNLTMLYQNDKVITFDEATTESGVKSREIWRGDDTWESMQDFVFYDFIEAITEKREPQTSLEKALIIQKIFDGIYKSAETGEAAKIG
jgi:predicted dehydrogenase